MCLFKIQLQVRPIPIKAVPKTVSETVYQYQIKIILQMSIIQRFPLSEMQHMGPQMHKNILTQSSLSDVGNNFIHNQVFPSETKIFHFDAQLQLPQIVLIQEFCNNFSLKNIQQVYYTTLENFHDNIMLKNCNSKLHHRLEECHLPVHQRQIQDLHDEILM